LRLFATQVATNPSPKQRMRLKIRLFKNFGASLLLLLHSFQKMQIESASILPNALAISLFAFCWQGQVGRIIRKKRENRQNTVLFSKSPFLQSQRNKN